MCIYATFVFPMNSTVNFFFVLIFLLILIICIKKSVFRWESLYLYLSRYFFRSFLMNGCVLLLCAFPFFPVRFNCVVFFFVYFSLALLKHTTTDTTRYTLMQFFFLSFCFGFVLPYIFTVRIFGFYYSNFSVFMKIRTFLCLFVFLFQNQTNQARFLFISHKM